jgi:hypothetical protein
MAENIPNVPTGAVPPKKETGKVQPKKETVRINLPPKPSAAPTIKLPTLPPGGPTGASAAPVAAPAPTGAPATAAPAAPRASAAPVASRPAAAPASVSRPAPAKPAAAAATVGGLDKGLAVTAAILGVVAAASVAYLLFMVFPPE